MAPRRGIYYAAKGCVVKEPDILLIECVSITKPFEKRTIRLLKTKVNINRAIHLEQCNRYIGANQRIFQ